MWHAQYSESKNAYSDFLYTEDDIPQQEPIKRMKFNELSNKIPVSCLVPSSYASAREAGIRAKKNFQRFGVLEKGF